MDGVLEGVNEEKALGYSDGSILALYVGCWLGRLEGFDDKLLVGESVRVFDGINDGIVDSFDEGTWDGSFDIFNVGSFDVSNDGRPLCASDGVRDGWLD